MLVVVGDKIVALMLFTRMRAVACPMEKIDLTVEDNLQNQ